MASPEAFLIGRGRIVGGTIISAAVIAGFGLAYLFGNVLFSLFIGVVLATALKPFIDGLQRCGLRQPVAVGAVYICMILLLTIVLVVGVPPLASRVRELTGEIPWAQQQAHQWLDKAGDVPWANLTRRLVAALPVGHAPIEIEQSLTTVGETASYLTIAAYGLMQACMIVLLAFYWSLQEDRTIRWLLLLLPVERRKGARETVEEIEGKVGAYLRGQGLVCLAMTVMAAVVYGLLGLRYVLVLSLIAGLMEVMPVLGPLIGALPPLVVALFTDPAKTPWVLGAAILMQQAESYLIVPPIMDKSVGVHPIVTLLAIAAFGSLLGIAGAILAIPLAAIVQVLLNRFVLGPAVTQRESPSGRGALSVLHYDTQKLLLDIRQRDKSEISEGNIGNFAEELESIAHDLDQGLKDVEGQIAAEGAP